jgi:hypothetical protein
VERRTAERYSHRGNDFGSVRGEATTTIAFAHGDWSVRTVTRTVLTSDETHFYIDARIDAYEGERRVFAEDYYRKIERDHV